MEYNKLVDYIEKAVTKILNEDKDDVFVFTEKVLSLVKIRKIGELNYKKIKVPVRCIITSEAKDFIRTNGILIIEN